MLIVQVGGEEHRFQGSIQRASFAPKVISAETRFAQASTVNPAAPIGEMEPLKKDASLVVPKQATSKPAAALQSATLPVYAGDLDRPYRVLGTVGAVLKRETAFLNAPITPDKANAALWQKATKLHADAVIHASLAKPHGTLINYQEAEATGVAVAYTSEPPAKPQ